MIAVTIENSTYCGADCLTCVRKKMKNVNQNMPDSLFYKIIDELTGWNRGELEAISFVGTGDPLLDPGFINKIKYIKEQTNLKIHLTNTCHQLKGDIMEAVCKYVDSLKISHYGDSKTTFNKVHGNIPYEETLSNIESLLKRTDRPKVSMTFLMIEENAHEKDSWLKKWEGKCDVVDIWTPHNWGGLYRDSTGIGEAKSCNRPGRDFQIHVDGLVSVCCLDVCEDLIVGDLKKERWEDILNGEKLNRIIELHRECRFDECGICGNCDLIYDRKDALIYSSDVNMKVGRKAGFSANSVDFMDK